MGAAANWPPCSPCRSTDDADDKNGFRHRVLSLALEAYRRDRITRAKLVELAALLSMREEEVYQLLERAGLADGESADVLIPGGKSGGQGTRPTRPSSQIRTSLST